MRKLFLLLPFVASLSFAISIKSITYKGLIHLSPQIANEITNLKVGSEFNYDLSDYAIKQLFKQGYFTDIWIDEDKGNVIVNVTEKPTIALIEFSGVSEDDKKVLKDILGIKKGMVYDKKAIDLAKKRITQYYEAKGYFDTVVEQTPTPLDEKSSLKTTFKINRGENITIENVKLSGAKHLDYSDIEPYVANKQREIFGWMWGFNDGKLVPVALLNDSQKIKDEFLAKGYLDVSVSNPYLKLYYDTYKANILYQINEGNRYKVSKITYTLQDDVISTKELSEDLKLEKDDVFNVKKLRADINMMETKIANLGYAFVRIYPDTVQDKNTSTVSINYIIEPNQKVNINKVVISGNTRTADNVIRRDLYLVEGDLYNKTSLNDSIDALKRTGYFDDVSIQETRVSQNTLDLHVSVKETSTGSIRGGIGYGSSDGLLFDIGVSDKNIFGSGIQGSANMSRSDDELSGKISLYNPRIYDSVYSLGGSIYVEDNDWDSYEEKIEGLSINGGRKIFKNTHVSLEYILQNTNLTKLNQSLKDIGYTEGKSLKSSIIPSITYNSTDDYYLPRRGLIASTTLEYAGIGGDEKFIKSISSLKLFYGLQDWLDWDLILRYKARVRMIKNKGFLPINERLYLGGLSSVRGFDSRSIGPKNAKGYEYGGTKSFNNTFEASVPLIKRIKMRMAFFYDYGMIGEKNFDDYERSSTGVAIEWLSPLGAINLVFAKPLDEKKGDETTSFEFSIGRQF